MSANEIYVANHLPSPTRHLLALHLPSPRPMSPVFAQSNILALSVLFQSYLLYFLPPSHTHSLTYHISAYSPRSVDNILQFRPAYPHAARAPEKPHRKAPLTLDSSKIKVCIPPVQYSENFLHVILCECCGGEGCGDSCLGCVEPREQTSAR